MAEAGERRRAMFAEYVNSKQDESVCCDRAELLKVIDEAERAERFFDRNTNILVRCIEEMTSDKCKCVACKTWRAMRAYRVQLHELWRERGRLHGRWR